jgi:hypothetical protein
MSKPRRPALESNRTAEKKRQFLAAYQAKACNISQACAAVDISRSTFYDWLTTDLLFAAAIKDIDEALLDWAESMLFKGIKDGDHTLLIFFLKTKGKGRGYIEKVDVGGQLGVNLRFEYGKGGQ